MVSDQSCSIYFFSNLRIDLRAQIWFEGALVYQQQIPKAVCKTQLNFWRNDVICDVMIFL